MAKLVLTAIGDDRPGLVSTLATAVQDAGGNWLESQMGRLAGTFAGIVLVDIGEAGLPALKSACEKLGTERVLDITFADADQSKAAPVGEPLHVFVLGHDRLGIVREVSAALSSLGVTIERLETITREAPMGDGTLFEADADVLVPQGVTQDAVRHAIEELAHDLVVDLDVPADPAGDPATGAER